MTLLGAGGAATSILVQAALDGLSEISVFSIHDQFYVRAEQIVQTLNERTNCKVQLFDFEDDSILRRDCRQLYPDQRNFCGHGSNTDASIINDPSFFHKDLIVSDVIYNPKETKLLRLAREAGCPTFNGLYMLLYQGAEAFKLWTGQEMPVEKIKELYFS